MEDTGEKIDGLILYKVSLSVITEDGHACKGEVFPKSAYDRSLLEDVKGGFLEPLVLYKQDDKLAIADGWHRYKSAILAGYLYIIAVVFNSREECHPTSNLRW